MVTATETMMEWANVGWRHFAVIGFVYTLALALASIFEGADVLFNIGATATGMEVEDNVNIFRPWVMLYLPLLSVIPLVLVGVLVMRFGRFMVMIVTLGACMALTPLGILATTTPMWAAHVFFSSDLFQFILLGLSVIYIYESFPVKYRRIALLAIGIFASLGKVFFTLAYQMGDAESLDNHNLDYWHYAIMFSVLPLAIPFIIGVAFLRKDTLPSLVDRGYESAVYDHLVGLKKFSASSAAMTPVIIEPPMCKAEFQFQVEAERLNAFTSFTNALIRKWKALVFLLITSFNVQLFEQMFCMTYTYLAYDYFGEGYNGQPTKGRTYVNFFAVAGVLFGIFVVARFKKITLLPGIAATCLAIGAALLTPINMFDENRLPLLATEVENISQIVAGISIAYFGLYLAQFVQCLMIVEIVPSQYRPVFVMIAMAIRQVWLVAARALSEEYFDNYNAMVASTVVLFLIAIANFAILGMTNWICTLDPAIAESTSDDDLEKAVSEYSLYEEGDKINDVQYLKANTASTKTSGNNKSA